MVVTTIHFMLNISGDLCKYVHKVLLLTVMPYGFYIFLCNKRGNIKKSKTLFLCKKQFSMSKRSFTEIDP